MSETQHRSADSDARQMSTAPAEDDAPTGLGVAGWLRWIWRQLTSMRTALLLLFLLALGSIPGSILPQRPVDPAEVDRYIADNPGVGEVFDRLGFFDVFASAWYVAIFLLLLVSLIGCIIPRSAAHWRAIRREPPAAPRRLTRMPEYESWTVDDALDASDRIAAAGELLRSKRWRVAVDAAGPSPSVAAEKGYLREVGNLVFHLAIVVLLVAVALGGLLGWRGQAMLVEGETFTNTLTQYDSFNGGTLVDSDQLPPFSMTLDSFDATFETQGEQRGAPRGFEADVTFTESPGAPAQTQIVRVNEPLVVDGAKAFLVGHGYAPVIKVTDKSGQVIYDAPTAFLQTDGNFTSSGVVKLPDNDPQLGFQGLFLPTAAVDEVRGPHSTFPELLDPAIFLSAWSGNLGLDDGVPQSVFQLDTAEMEQLGIKALRVGEKWQLPDQLGTVTLTGVKQYAVFDVAYDPTKEIALIASILAIAGLMMSLFIPRRRVWVRIRTAESPPTLEMAALSRNDESGLRPALDELVADVRELVPPAPMTDAVNHDAPATQDTEDK